MSYFPQLFCMNEQLQHSTLAVFMLRTRFETSLAGELLCSMRIAQNRFRRHTATFNMFRCRGVATHSHIRSAAIQSCYAVGALRFVFATVVIVAVTVASLPYYRGAVTNNASVMRTKPYVNRPSFAITIVRVALAPRSLSSGITNTQT